MSRGVRDLRELINVSRLSFREDHGQMNASHSNLSEIEDTESEKQDRNSGLGVTASPLSGGHSTNSGPLEGTGNRLFQEISCSSDYLSFTASRGVSEPLNTCFEEIVPFVDAESLKDLLLRSNEIVSELSQWWQSPDNACKCIHFWLKEVQEGKRLELLNLEYSVVRDEVQSAFTISLTTGEVKIKDVYSLLRVALHEYPTVLCSLKGKKYALDMMHVVTSGRSQTFRNLLTDVNYKTKNKIVIETLLGIRSFGLVSLLKAIVKFFCEVTGKAYPIPSPESQPGAVSLLQHAVSNGYISVVRYCWERNREQFSELDGQGRSVIFLAVLHNQQEILKYLSDKALHNREVDVDVPSSSGNTPLHVAATNGNLECLRCLVKAAAKVNVWNPQAEGATPLHLAVMYGHKNVVIDLLKAGAVLDAKMGIPATKTSLDLAQEFEHHDITQLLKSALSS